MPKGGSAIALWVPVTAGHKETRSGQAHLCLEHDPASTKSLEGFLLLIEENTLKVQDPEPQQGFAEHLLQKGPCSEVPLGASAV